MSMQLPFLDMLWVISAAFGLSVRRGCRHRQPMSPRRTGLAPSGMRSRSWSSRSGRRAMPGLADVDHATIPLPPESHAGAR